MIIAFLLGFSLALWVAVRIVNAAYRNGCRDGFRFAHDPLHPTVVEAGEAIRLDATLTPYLGEASPESKP